VGPTKTEPIGSYIRQLGLSFSTADGVTQGRLPVHNRLFGAPGLPRIGVLTILADCVAGFDALSAFDMAWVGTSELGIHGPFAPMEGDEVVATGRLLKRRKNGGVFVVTLRDDEKKETDPPLATATVTLSLLSQQAGTKLDSAINKHIDELSSVQPLRTLADLIDPRMRNDGTLELRLTDNVRNSWRVLSGGVSALLAELAAQRAADVALGGPSMVDGLALHFLAPGRVGPVQARAEVLSAQTNAEAIAPGKAHLSFSLTDAGADDREVVVGTATAHRLPA
jgi:acyl-coenzyme A thioesterase PaaI-like protein